MAFYATSHEISHRKTLNFIENFNCLALNCLKLLPNAYKHLLQQLKVNSDQSQ